MKITLKACRINAEMSQAQFAEALGVSPATIYNWEAGKTEPSLSQLRQISTISGITIDNIVVGNNS